MSFANNELRKINVPVTTEIIGDYSFKENKIEKLQLHANLTYLGVGAFEYNYIEELIINENIDKGLTTINDNAFQGNMLRNVTLPYTLEHIGNYAFSENILLESITIPRNVNTIEFCAFCNNQLSTIINKTGKKFDWNGILTHEEGEEFETGSVNIMPCEEDDEIDCNIYTDIKSE